MALVFPLSLAGKLNRCVRPMTSGDVRLMLPLNLAGNVDWCIDLVTSGNVTSVFRLNLAEKLNFRIDPVTSGHVTLMFPLNLGGNKRVYRSNDVRSRDVSVLKFSGGTRLVFKSRDVNFSAKLSVDTKLVVGPRHVNFPTNYNVKCTNERTEKNLGLGC